MDDGLELISLARNDALDDMEFYKDKAVQADIGQLNADDLDPERVAKAQRAANAAFNRLKYAKFELQHFDFTQIHEVPAVFQRLYDEAAALKEKRAQLQKEIDNF